VQGSGFRVLPGPLPHQVWDSGFRVQGFDSRVLGVGSKVWGVGVRV